MFLPYLEAMPQKSNMDQSITSPQSLLNLSKNFLEYILFIFQLVAFGHFFSEAGRGEMGEKGII